MHGSSQSSIPSLLKGQIPRLDLSKVTNPDPRSEEPTELKSFSSLKKRRQLMKTTLKHLRFDSMLEQSSFLNESHSYIRDTGGSVLGSCDITSGHVKQRSLGGLQDFKPQLFKRRPFH